MPESRAARQAKDGHGEAADASGRQRDPGQFGEPGLNSPRPGCRGRRRARLAGLGGVARGDHDGQGRTSQHHRSLVDHARPVAELARYNGGRILADRHRLARQSGFVDFEFPSGHQPGVRRHDVLRSERDHVAEAEVTGRHDVSVGFSGILGDRVTGLAPRSPRRLLLAKQQSTQFPFGAKPLEPADQRVTDHDATDEHRVGTRSKHRRRRRTDDKHRCQRVVQFVDGRRRQLGAEPGRPHDRCHDRGID